MITTFKQFLEMFEREHRPRRVESVADLEHIAKKDQWGEAKVLVVHKHPQERHNGRVYAWPGEGMVHDDAMHTIFKRQLPEKVSGGTFSHRDGKNGMEHSEWTSLSDSSHSVKVGNAKDFHSHPLISKVKKI